LLNNALLFLRDLNNLVVLTFYVILTSNWNGFLRVDPLCTLCTLCWLGL